jgi:hypothetical protein
VLVVWLRSRDACPFPFVLLRRTQRQCAARLTIDHPNCEVTDTGSGSSLPAYEFRDAPAMLGASLMPECAEFTDPATSRYHTSTPRRSR